MKKLPAFLQRLLLRRLSQNNFRGFSRGRFRRGSRDELYLILAGVAAAALCLSLFFWWRGSDSLKGAVFQEPVFYWHTRIRPANQGDIKKIFNQLGLVLPANLREISFFSVESDAGLAWYLISRGPVNPESQKNGRVYLTSLSKIESNQISEKSIGPGLMPRLIKKPWIWFGQPDYGFITSSLAVGLGYGESPLKPSYFKTDFKKDHLKVSVLPMDWQFKDFFKTRPQGNLLKIPFPDVEYFHREETQLFFLRGLSEFRFIFKQIADQSVSGFSDLAQNSDWQELERWSDQGWLFLSLNQTSGNWFASITSSKELPLKSLEVGSRVFFANVWPILVKRNLADGTSYQEWLADTDAYQWERINYSSASLYKLNRQVVGRDIYMAFKDNIVWLTNNANLIEWGDFRQVRSSRDLFKALKFPQKCSYTAQNPFERIFYSGFLPFGDFLANFQSVMVVDKGYAVDICIDKIVDK